MERMLNVSQVADVLGLAKITVYKLVSARAIPHYRLGKCIRFKTEEVVDWLREVPLCSDTSSEGSEVADSVPVSTQAPPEP